MPYCRYVQADVQDKNATQPVERIAIAQKLKQFGYKLNLAFSQANSTFLADFLMGSSNSKGARRIWKQIKNNGTTF